MYVSVVASHSLPPVHLYICKQPSHFPRLLLILLRAVLKLSVFTIHVLGWGTSESLPSSLHGGKSSTGAAQGRSRSRNVGTNNGAHNVQSACSSLDDMHMFCKATPISVQCVVRRVHSRLSSTLCIAQLPPAIEKHVQLPLKSHCSKLRSYSIPIKGTILNSVKIWCIASVQLKLQHNITEYRLKNEESVIQRRSNTN